MSIIVSGRCVAKQCFPQNSDVGSLLERFPDDSVIFENGRVFAFAEKYSDGDVPFVSELPQIIGRKLLNALFGNIDNTIGGCAAIIDNGKGRLFWEF